MQASEDISDTAADAPAPLSPTPAAVVRALYRGVSGFGTDRIGPDGRRLRPGKALVYGELTAVGIRQLIAATGLAAGDRFVDLGSGTGRIPLHVALAVPGTTCLGIEIDRQRHRIACAVRDRAELEGLLAPGRCSFRNADLRTTDFAGGTVYFANSTCFPKRLLGHLVGCLAAMPGPLVFATFTELSIRAARGFDREDTTHCQTSWSNHVRLRVYRRGSATTGASRSGGTRGIADIAPV